MMDSTNTTRLVACAILFVGTLVMGTLPVYILQLMTRCMQKSRNDSTEHSVQHRAWWRRLFTHDRVVAFLTQFGGGVLLYTSLIHMLPEIRENYEKYLNSNDSASSMGPEAFDEFGSDEAANPDDIWHSQPMVDIFMCVGFFGIFLVEEVMHSICLGGHSHGHSEPVVTPVRRTPKRLSLRNYLQGQRNYTHYIDEVDVANQPPCPVTNGTNGTKKRNSLVMLPETHPISSHSPSSYHTCEQGKHCQGHHLENMESQSDNLSEITEKEPSIWTRMLDNFLLILAFSCHSIFDGISIGVQENESEIWTMLIAILSHKLIIAFILSFQIHEKCTQAVPDPRNPLETIQKPIKGAKVVLWFFSTLFALMSPLGIITIVAINESSQAPDESSLRIIILAAISAGTIIYIVFMEIIDKSSSRVHISGIVQWLALVVGFAVMHLISQQFHE